MKLFAKVFAWIKQLFKKDDQPEFIKIQADQSKITIIYIHRD